MLVAGVVRTADPRGGAPALRGRVNDSGDERWTFVDLDKTAV
jgi:hypothetical protein